jgi:hypothetical protein
VKPYRLREADRFRKPRLRVAQLGARARFPLNMDNKGCAPLVAAARSAR